jgi:hypothetical protein
MVVGSLVLPTLSCKDPPLSFPAFLGRPHWWGVGPPPSVKRGALFLVWMGIKVEGTLVVHPYRPPGDKALLGKVCLGAVRCSLCCFSASICLVYEL